MDGFAGKSREKPSQHVSIGHMFFRCHLESCPWIHKKSPKKPFSKWKILHVEAERDCALYQEGWSRVGLWGFWCLADTNWRKGSYLYPLYTQVRLDLAEDFC